MVRVLAQLHLVAALFLPWLPPSLTHICLLIIWTGKQTARHSSSRVQSPTVKCWVCSPPRLVANCNVRFPDASGASPFIQPIFTEHPRVPRPIWVPG